MTKKARRWLRRDLLTWFAALPPVPHRLRGWILRAASIDVARSAQIRAGLRIVGRARVTLGEGSFLNEGVYLDASDAIVIDELAQIGDHVRFITSTHDISPEGARIAGASRTSPIHVGSGAWIGSGATVLPGVNVGSHAILGAGAVAVRNLEPYGVYVGVPARLARMIQPKSM